MSDGNHKGKGHGKGGFASQRIGSDGLTGQQRAKLAGLKGAIAHSIKVYGHSEEEYEELWQKKASSIKSEH